MESHHPSSNRKPFNGEHSFDDDGHKVQAVPFEYPMEGDGIKNQEDVRRAMQEATIRTMQFFFGGNKTPQEAGRLGMIKLHLLRPQKTQRELAIQLGISPGRLSQILNSEKLESDQWIQADSSANAKLN